MKRHKQLTRTSVPAEDPPAPLHHPSVSTPRSWWTLGLVDWEGRRALFGLVEGGVRGGSTGWGGRGLLWMRRKGVLAGERWSD